METSVIATSNVTNFQECVLELVLNSLNAKATAIAIRFDSEKRKIQVIDNGTGISKKKLMSIAEYNAQNICWNVEDICNIKKQTLANIRRLSDAMIITSRHFNSSKTYTKVCKVGYSPNIVKVQGRPTSGTTVSIHGFHELTFRKWNIPLMYLTIGNIAIVNLQVSFSIRDDQEKIIIMSITKPHKSVDIFKLLYGKEISFNNLWYINNTNESHTKFCAFIGLSSRKSNATQYILLNNRPVHCPLILQVISNAFVSALRLSVKARLHQIPKRKAIFILLFISCTEHIFTLEKGKKTLILPSVRNLLFSIQHEIQNILFNNIKPLSNIKSIKLIKKTLTVRQRFPKKDYKLHTVCQSIRQETMKFMVPKLQGTTIDKSNVILLNYSDLSHNEDNNMLEEYRDNKPVHEMTVNRLAKNKINNIQSFTRESLRKNAVEETSVLALTQWSNWSYHDNKSFQLKESNKHDNAMLFYEHFDFLPKKLHKLLRGNTKLTKTDLLKEWGGSESSARLKSGLDIPDILLHQEIDVRPCKDTEQFREFKLKKELLKFVTILGQMNNELIVGLAVKNDAKMLLLMDQHAIHERIRYENLLCTYKSQIKNQLLSTKLRNPVVIQLTIEECNVLLKHKIQFKKFGVGFSIVNDSTVVVHTLPECLLKNKYHYDEFKLKLNAQNFLHEMIQNLMNNKCHESIDLPVTIHNALAMEACRGAIKFGDPLTLQQCKWLVMLLQKTNIPTRCAHGRPSIIPVLELSALEKWNKKAVQGTRRPRCLFQSS